MAHLCYAARCNADSQVVPSSDRVCRREYPARPSGTDDLRVDEQRRADADADREPLPADLAVLCPTCGAAVPLVLFVTNRAPLRRVRCPGCTAEVVLPEAW